MYYWVLSQECMYLLHNTCSWLVTCSTFHCRIKTKSKAKTCAQKDKFQFLRRCSRKFLRWAIKPTTCFCMRYNRHVCVKYFVIVDYRAFIFHIKDYITKWWQWLLPSGRTLCIENKFVGIFFYFLAFTFLLKLGQQFQNHTLTLHKVVKHKETVLKSDSISKYNVHVRSDYVSQWFWILDSIYLHRLYAYEYIRTKELGTKLCL